MLPASLALVLRAFPARRIPFAVAIWGSTGALAGAIGPTVGALLVEFGGWRWVFLINIPIGIFTVIVGRRYLSESNVPDAVVPAPLGVVLIAAAAEDVDATVLHYDADFDRIAAVRETPPVSAVRCRRAPSGSPKPSARSQSPAALLPSCRCSPGTRATAESSGR